MENLAHPQHRLPAFWLAANPGLASISFTLQDMRLVWKNCFTYNAKDSPVGKLGKLGEREWEQRWAASGLSSSEARARRNNAGIAAAKYEPALGPPSKRASGAALSGGRHRVSCAGCCLEDACIMLGLEWCASDFFVRVRIILVKGAALFGWLRCLSMPAGTLPAASCLPCHQTSLAWCGGCHRAEASLCSLPPLGLLPLPAVAASAVSAQRSALFSKLPDSANPHQDCTVFNMPLLHRLPHAILN